MEFACDHRSANELLCTADSHGCSAADSICVYKINAANCAPANLIDDNRSLKSCTVSRYVYCDVIYCFIIVHTVSAACFFANNVIVCSNLCVFNFAKSICAFVCDCDFFVYATILNVYERAVSFCDIESEILCACKAVTVKGLINGNLHFIRCENKLVCEHKLIFANSISCFCKANGRNELAAACFCFHCNCIFGCIIVHAEDLICISGNDLTKNICVLCYFAERNMECGFSVCTNCAHCICGSSCNYAAFNFVKTKEESCFADAYVMIINNILINCELNKCCISCMSISEILCECYNVADSRNRITCCVIANVNFKLSVNIVVCYVNNDTTCCCIIYHSFKSVRGFGDDFGNLINVCTKRIKSKVLKSIASAVCCYNCIVTYLSVNTCSKIIAFKFE